MEITQYHFTAWPDHGVPESNTPIMALHKVVMTNWRKNRGPILVHCSAGVGHTGTFITIDIALEQAEREGMMDIAGIVNRLREERMKMVQTEVRTKGIFVCLHLSIGFQIQLMVMIRFYTVDDTFSFSC